MSFLQVLRPPDFGTLLGRTLVRQIRVGGLLIPVESVDRVLSRYCVNLAKCTGDPEYEIQLCGSASALQYAGRNLAFCTQHQMRDEQFSEYALLVKDQRRIVTSSRYLGYRKRELAFAVEAYDACVLDFTMAVGQYASLGKHFLSVTDGHFLDEWDSVVCYALYGCPFVDQDYDVYDRRHLGTSVRLVVCKHATPTSDPSMVSLRSLVPADFDPNGMSGGPVFAIVGKGLEYTAKFAGIITRSNGQDYTAIRAGALLAIA